MPYTYPRQLKGIGMSRMAANQEIENSYFVDTNRQGLDALLGSDTNWVRTQFLARITKAVTLQTIGLDSVRWTYSIQRQILPATTNQYDASIADEDALIGTAYNIYEWYHSGGTLGDGTLYASLPDGVTLNPVDGLVMVWAWQTSRPVTVATVSTDVVFLFDRNNGYSCPEGEG